MPAKRCGCREFTRQRHAEGLRLLAGVVCTMRVAMFSAQRCDKAAPPSTTFVMSKVVAGTSPFGCRSTIALAKVAIDAKRRFVESSRPGAQRTTARAASADRYECWRSCSRIEPSSGNDPVANFEYTSSSSTSSSNFPPACGSKVMVEMLCLNSVRILAARLTA